MKSSFIICLGFGATIPLLFCSASYAQETVNMSPGVNGPSMAQLRQETFQVGVRNAHQQRIVEQLKMASPLTYYDSDWRPGTVKLANGQEIKAPMRYNLVARALEIQRPGPPAKPDSVLLLPQFQAAQFGTALPSLFREFVAHPYQSDQSRHDLNLFEKINSVPGPVDLLLLHEVVAQTTSSAFAPGGTGRPADQRIERVSRLYARTPKRTTVQEINLNKTGVLYLFGKDANRMASYASAHKLTFVDLAHVVQIVDEYNRTVQPE
ncbi:hypothetical protein [Hymenobacter radiodurans]|uniref:hypothetical protein n=1 Tax=Hymenobacter radiodurans TaxID=2496028 RepID=UPI0010584D24|nr:hypothetical protein [Hymenobacter radiodurans]